MKKSILSLLLLLFISLQLHNLNISAETINQPSSLIGLEDVKDISKDFWGTEAILEVLNNGYMEVNDNGTFQPNEKIGRGEAAGIITRALGFSLDSEVELNAKDVPVTHSYYHEIRKLVELGILQNGEYIRPDEYLKRSEVSALISRAYNIEVDGVNQKGFNDYDPDFWAKDTIESLADLGIIHGTSISAFSPNENVTKAQLATLIIRGEEFVRKVNNLEIAYDYLAKEYIPTINDFSNWSNDVVTFVNLEREKVGLESLNQDLSLNQLSIIKAQDMINRYYFDHKSPFYGYPWDMATLFDYEYLSLGENIARNYHSPEDVVSAWMASPSHRDNILKENYTYIGVGVKKDDEGKYYWVQMFSSK